MGNYRFRLSDMIPNAWFYKLKDMSKTKSHTNSQHSTKKSNNSQPRQSFYYTIETTTQQREKLYNSPRNPKVSDTHFPDPPRKSSKKTKPKRKTVYKPSPRQTTITSETANCNCRVWNESSEAIQARNYLDFSTGSSPDLNHFINSSSSEFEPHIIDPNQWSSSCSCRYSSSVADIIFDMNEKLCTRESKKMDNFSKISANMDLHPIITKPKEINYASEEAFRYENPSQSKKLQPHRSFSIKISTEESINHKKETRKSISSGVKVGGNSPKLASKKLQGHGRKSVSSKKRLKSEKKGVTESFAVVKASVDPEKDFRESMMEMIVENNIRASTELEELLACYLSLNLDEYHDLIIKAFEQIWFSMPQIIF